MFSKLSFLGVLVLSFFFISSANAATFVVTKTADTNDGACNADCSFREALTAANQNGGGADIINFNIPGSGVKTIFLSTELPSIQTSLTINGQTQSGFFGKPLIELRGVPAINQGLKISSSLIPGGAEESTVAIYSLAINSFGQYGINSACIARCEVILKGNFIGTDPTGTIAMPNKAHGVNVYPSANSVTTIGGSGIFEGNLISGNGDGDAAFERGINVEPVPVQGSLIGDATVNIIGNKIGTDFNGDVDLGNDDDGVYVSEHSQLGSFHALNINLTIGGSTTTSRNVISGNNGRGIYADVTRATIKGNYIGTNAAGTFGLGNRHDDHPDSGISLYPHPGGVYLIGGTGANDGNVIADNGSNGISIDSFVAWDAVNVPVHILGNRIGTNAAGTADLGNGSNGIDISPVSVNLDVTIGGIGSAANLISGNGNDGVAVNGETVKIYSNKIGTNIDGSAAIGNGGDGISLVPYPDEMLNATIGGTAVIDDVSYDLGNTISGNQENGIRFSNNGSELYSPVTIRRNRIGTNTTGTSAVPNSLNGIKLFEVGATIGSSANFVDGNIISGNGDNGILVQGDAGAHPSAIHGNKIGTNGVGGSPVPNGENGIHVVGSSDNQIGVAGVPASTNVIAGNTSAGVLVDGAASTGNAIYNNLIGTGPAANDLGNIGPGVQFLLGASGNFVGGSNGAGNTIAFNAKGVWVFNGLDNEIRRNVIYSNDDLGIDVDVAGVTPNDLGDADGGANRKQNFPVLTRATPSGISGTLNSTANGNFTVDFYRTDSCEANGHGEGRYYLGSTFVTTDGSGNGSFNYAGSVTIGQVVTATATVTDIVGADDTSEFSQCKVVTAAPTVAFSTASYSVNEGAASRTIIVTRSGATDGPVSVNYATSNGTATAGQDYTAANGTLNFADSETVKSFDVLVTNDAFDEPDETVNIALSNPTNGAGLGAQSSTVLTIADNDATPELAINSVSANEGNSGTTSFTFNITLSAASGQTVGVHYETEEGTSTPGTDFTPAVGNLSFAPGEVSKTVTVTVVGDTVPEPDETFFLLLSAPTNATVGASGGVGTIVNDDSSTVPARTRFDYDGDGKADVSIFRPSNGQWWLDRSSAGVIAGTFGSGSDKIVPADYTGDGKTDLAIWRPSTGEWFILRSEDSSYYSFPFGTTDDIPAPADYDGDGKADPAVFRPSTTTWYVSKSTGGTLITNFGSPGDVPVVDDYDRDGKADIAIFRPSNGQWWLNRSTEGVIATTFGTSSDKPVHGDLTGDGRADIAFWRPSTGEWFVVRSEDSSYFSFPFGANGDKPSLADFDGDGRFDPTVFRPSTATWYISRSSQGIMIQTFGVNGDLPTTAAFVP